MVVHEILLPLPLPALSYGSPDILKLGELVEVECRRKKIVGLVLGQSDYKGEVKPIIQRLGYSFTPSMCHWLQWCANYTCTPVGLFLKMALINRFKKIANSVEKVDHIIPKVDLTPKQQEVFNEINCNLEKSLFSPIVIRGVTGSGKTEVYLAAALECLKSHKQVLILLPEIALSSTWVKRFQDHTGYSPIVWHSNLTPKRREEAWSRIASGQAVAVVGTRSALFLPFQHMGLIVVDEEHDQSFKQDDGVCYNARDLAVAKAKFENCPILLVSATPSMETEHNISQERYEVYELDQRYAGATLPTIKTIDLKQHRQRSGFLSKPTLDAISRTLAESLQTLIFINRRGYAPVTLCKKCGFHFTCPACQTNLVYHQSKQQLICHHCGHLGPNIHTCPQCNSNEWHFQGPGVERIAEEVSKNFPSARLAVVSSEITSKKFELICDQVHQQEVDIIIGTQILAKGHHFPLLTLVIVVDADSSLSGVDFRAGERTYQLLEQVSGRAGRADLPGEVLVQTYQPDHPAILALINQDRHQFVAKELELRKQFKTPPFSRWAAIILSGPNLSQVEEVARHWVKHAPSHPDFAILGPVPAPLAKLRNNYRWRILVRSHLPISEYMRVWQNACRENPRVKVKIDIDPYDFL